MEGGQDDDLDTSSSRVLIIPKATPGTRRPGRPRKNPEPVITKEDAKYPDENGALVGFILDL